MEDKQIIQLYFERSENAIRETDMKYGAYCHKIARNILSDAYDEEDCVNDTYLHAWNAIPPTVPECLKSFLGAITRNLSLNKIKARMRQKRCVNEFTLVYDEIEYAIPASWGTEELIDKMYLEELIRKFVAELSPEYRAIFVGRYWYFESVHDISQKLQISESKTKMVLLRLRKKLKKCLEEEGVVL